MRVAMVLCAIVVTAQAVELRSPDGQVRLTIQTKPALEYTVTLKGKTVIEPSVMGITVDGVNPGEGIKAEKAQGVKKGPYCNGQAVALSGQSAFSIEARACNGGVAFRFLVAGQGARTPDEVTAFRPAAGSVVWYHDLEGHYEALHKKSGIAEIAAGEWAAPPVTFKLPDGAGYGSITEAALYHYAGMALQADGKGTLLARLGHTHPPSYPFRLRYKEDIERVSKPASIEGPIMTPWRVVMVGGDLNALVNSRMIAELSPAPDQRVFPQGNRTDWVKPGRAVWKYLDGGENTQETVREFSRLASQLGFEYQVVEGFWSKWPKAELRTVIDESRRLGVGLFLWKHSNQLRTPEARKEFFDLCAEVGAAGAKIDFFDHEAKEVVELYEIMLREAAERKLLVNFHGANKPTGEYITWPNELTREGVRGMESRKSERARHDATLPFTRLLAGPADYTPVHFGERRNDTTWAHQIATAVVFTSPLLTYAAHPKSLLENPAVEIIKSIPAVWDETVVLPGSEIGEVAALARRRGGTWFVAAVNGTSPRTMKIGLSFLGTGEYEALMAREEPGNPAAVRMEKGRFSKGSVIDVEMPAGGGFVGRFVK